MKTNPYPSQQLRHVNNLDSYTAEVESVVTDVRNANVVTSEVTGTACFGGLHSPVLDIDMPCTLIESSTPGHYHLYIDKMMSWEAYKKLLVALADAGIIEPGYRDASIERGYTSVRLPWITKKQPESSRGYGPATLPAVNAGTP